MPRAHDDAAACYDRAARELLGEFALTNQEMFPDLLTAERVAEDAFLSRPPTPLSGFYGVVPQRSGRWAASIGGGKYHKHLGTFQTAELAARAYDAESFARRGRALPCRAPRAKQGDALF